MPITTISDLQKKYAGRIDHLDLELLLAHALGKPREFVLAYPEKILTQKQAEKAENYIKRRLQHEPIAYILGQKEFYGLPFEVTPATLIPRPETEMIVDETLVLLRSMLRNKVRTAVPTSVGTGIGTCVIDVGTGSGNIIISVEKSLESFCHPRVGGDPVAHKKVSTLDSRLRGNDIKFCGVDISREALCVARRNAKKNRVAEKIKFLHGNLLEPFLKDTKYKIQDTRYIILANLPYLSKEIYAATEPDVKKFEPKSALYSKNHGLDHYEKLFQQMKILNTNEANKLMKLQAILEISPEQKPLLAKLIKKYFPASKTQFKKDLAGRTRVATIKLQP